ncbi:MAG: methyltransferase domain-containing protein, partial [Pseudonocardiaceae bacterium]
DTERTRALRERMVTELVESGAITDDLWRQAFTAVPRHALVPRFYRTTDRAVIDSTNPDHELTWLEAVYSNKTLVTQITPTDVTSSGTMPGLLAKMLTAIRINTDDNVLHVGTGTGYTAALLCQRLGSNKVTTIDIDPDLSNDARTRLDHLGYTPTVVTGNGARGYPPNAPYDAILATCALRRIPAEWLAQAVPGARIAAPLATGLMALDVTGPDQASGRFLPPGGFFMPLRDTHQQDKPTTPAHGTRRDPRPTELGPLQTFYEDHLRFLLTVALPDVSTSQHGPALEDLTISNSAGSTARLDRTDNGTFLVTEIGPRALWNEVEHLHQQWQAWGRPGRERYGLTANGESQTIWLDEPRDAPTWHLPSYARTFYRSGSNT